MTTLVGLKILKGKRGVVIGSDITRTQTSWQNQGDVAYRQQRKMEGQKIYFDNDKKNAICMSGVYDQSYVDFLVKFMNGKFDIEKVTKEGFFPEFLDLNLTRWQGRLPQNDFMNSLLMGSRINGEPELYTCWPLGRVEKRDATSLGSGSDYAFNYLSESGKLIPHISLEEGINLTVNALDKASQDPFTGGLDLIVITADEIYDLGKDIRKEVDNARAKGISSAIGKIK